MFSGAGRRLRLVGSRAGEVAHDGRKGLELQFLVHLGRVKVSQRFMNLTMLNCSAQVMRGHDGDLLLLLYLAARPDEETLEQLCQAWV